MSVEKELARVFLGCHRESPAELVICDHDSTLVDTEYAWQEGTRRWLENYGKKYDPKIRSKLTGKNQTEVTRILKQEYGLVGDVEELRKERLKIIMDLFEKTSRLIEPVIELIRFLSKQGFCLAIASGAPIEFLETSIKMFSLEGIFDLIISGDQVLRGKPCPDILFYVFAKAQEKKPEIRMADCVVIEDSLNGVLAAKRAGMRCLLVPGVITSGHLTKAKYLLSEATDLILAREELERIDYRVLQQEFGAAVL